MKSRVLEAALVTLLMTASSCGGDGQPSNSRVAGHGGSAGVGGSAGSTPGGTGPGGKAGGAGMGGSAGASTSGAAGTSGSGAGDTVGGNGGNTAGTTTGAESGTSGTGTAGTSAGGVGQGGASAAGGVSAGASGAGGARPTVTAAPGTTLVKLDASVRHQTFEGWGTSLCWWANHVGGWDTAARNAVVDAVVNPETGLGYNVFRYNIGGGENPAHDHMDEHRDMPGFSPAEGSFTWDADANQRAILERIVATGTDVILEAFSNSPPYWMTKSGCASGSSDGSNNLADDSYEAFADYLTEVVEHYRDTLGITFRTLEPLNEPNANWWRSNGTQEGCHFSPSSQETLIRAVAASLSEKGLTATVVSASDENSMDEAYDNLRGFASTTLAAIAQVNVHSYAGTRRSELQTLVTGMGKRLWQSESGPLNQTLSDDTEAALFMAGRIIADLRDLKPEAWLDWQVADPSRYWASVTLNDAEESFAPLKRFYMHAGFSRFIRPGAVFIDVNNPDMVAAVSANEQSVALVVRNGSTSATRGFTFDLTALPRVDSAVGVFRTSRTENLVSLPVVAIEDYSFVAMLPPYSVTTFVIAMP